MDLIKEQQRQGFRQRLFSYTIRLLKFLVKLAYNPVINEVKKQLTRSGTSIGANYFESEAASSKKDYQNYYSHSLKSANETKYWLCCLKSVNLVPNGVLEEWNWLFNETKELANIFASSIMTMRGKKNRKFEDF